MEVQPCGVWCVQKKVSQYCPRPRVDGQAVCEQHLNLRQKERERRQNLRENPEIRCTRCYQHRRAPDSILCGICASVNRRAQQKQNRERDRLAAAHAAGECGKMMTGTRGSCKRALVPEHGKCAQHHTHITRALENAARWRQQWVENGQAARGVRPALHEDGQNVHRREVAVIVNDLHAEEATSAHTGVLREIDDVWGDCPRKLEILADMTHWQNISQVRNPDDWAQRRMLHVVWDKIKTSKHRTELLGRLQEEARDSLGYCAEGHITRLANSLQGFEEPVMDAPKMSASEFLQNRMPKVMEIEDEGERVTAAEQLLRDAGLPEADWPKWIDAVRD